MYAPEMRMFRIFSPDVWIYPYLFNDFVPGFQVYVDTANICMYVCIHYMISIYYTWITHYL